MFGAGFDNAYFGGPPWEIPALTLTPVQISYSLLNLRNGFP